MMDADSKNWENDPEAPSEEIAMDMVWKEGLRVSATPLAMDVGDGLTGFSDENNPRDANVDRVSAMRAATKEAAMRTKLASGRPPLGSAPAPRCVTMPLVAPAVPPLPPRCNSLSGLRSPQQPWHVQTSSFHEQRCRSLSFASNRSASFASPGGSFIGIPSVPSMVRSLSHGSASFAPPLQVRSASFVPPPHVGPASFVPPSQGGSASFVPPPQGGPASFVPPPQGGYASVPLPPQVGPASFIPPAGSSAGVAPDGSKPAAALMNFGAELFRGLSPPGGVTNMQVQGTQGSTSEAGWQPPYSLKPASKKRSAMSSGSPPLKPSQSAK